MGEAGAAGFIAGLERLGVYWRREADLIIFPVLAAGGGRNGVEIESGVSIDELSRWPQIPPHWIHLPAEVAFTQTNARASTVANWTQHSRNMAGWGDAAEPAQAWVAHVRGVLEEAA